MFGYSLTRPSLFQDFFDDIYDETAKLGIVLEGLHTETGPGVYEVALKYGRVVELADNASLFKTSVKQLGLLQPTLHPGNSAIYPSFMAKPSSNLPGCSGHLHLSLMDSTGKNLFYDETDEHGMSQIFKHFVAGLLHCLPEILPMYAPTVNSYKRLVENYWAPVKVCWGLENRTAAVRVITPKTTGPQACTPKSTRAELRVSGSDMNVHLALAGCFASGLYGIAKKLSLPKPVDGDVGKDSASERLPKTLASATERMAREGGVAQELFGRDFVHHFIQSRREEYEQFDREVTNWETRRYFETV